MSPHDSKSPCAADALFNVIPLTVSGKTVGVLRLCDTIADVRLPGLREDTSIRAALIERAERTNVIPNPSVTHMPVLCLHTIVPLKKKDPTGGK